MEEAKGRRQKDVFEWDPSQPVVTAWSTTTKHRSNKIRRTYGTRRGSNNYASSSVLHKQWNDVFDSKVNNDETEISETSLSSELGYDRESESSLSSSNFSTFIAADSFVPPRRDVPPLPLRPSKTQHKRATSLSLPPPVPRPSFLKRASTIQNDIEESPTFRRSSNASSSSHRSSSSSIDSACFDLKENSHPNFELHEVLSPPESFMRKRVRARRGSMFNSYSSVMSAGRPPPHRRASMGNLSCSPSLFSEIARSSSQGDIGNNSWMSQVPRDSSLSPAKLPGVGLDLGEDSSPSTRSVANSVGSSRKRGMSEEPSDHDNDDMGSVVSFSVPRTSFANNKASEAVSRLFSTSVEGNTGPSYSTDLGYNDEGFQRKGRATELESDREEFDSDMENDSSVESMSETIESGEDPAESSSSNGLAMASTRVMATETVLTEEAILNSMSSYNDLKFLIRNLRQEKRNYSKKPTFGTTLGCTVAPPHSWAPDRRNCFIRWTSKYLGFSVRAAGPSVAFLQISRSKGMEILSLLESALILKKKHQQEGLFSIPQHELPDNAKKCIDNTEAQIVCASNCNSTVQELVNIVGDSAKWGADSADTILIESMNALSFKNADQRLTRNVTLDARDSAARLEQVSVGVSPKMSRSSVGSHCSALSRVDQNFMVNIHDLSPSNMQLSKPLRMSLCSITSTVSKNPRQVETTPINSSFPPPIANQHLTFDFVETPLMKQPFQGWGSQPIKGKDWGASEICSERTTKTLVQLMNVALIEAGLENDCEPISANGPSSRSAARTADLCLDMEAGQSTANEDSDGGYDYVHSLIELKTEGTPFKQMEALPSAEKLRGLRRRNISLAKHRRMSVCVSTARPSAIPKRKFLFQDRRQSFVSNANGELYHHEFFKPEMNSKEELAAEQPVVELLAERNLLQPIFSFLEGNELLTTVSLVCSSWADAATDAYAELVLASVGCSEVAGDADDDIVDADPVEMERTNTIGLSMRRSWNYLLTTFPYASFLSEGAFKKVYKVKNAIVNDVEAMSIMDVNLIESTGNKAVVGTELAVSVMLSSLARRGICPNFVITRGVFTCPHEPPASLWGSAENKNHQVHLKSPKKKRIPREPSPELQGNFQCIRMELCEEGDAEEYIKRQSNEIISTDLARILLCQIAFALHAAGSKYSLKHYDLKLLNIFLGNAKTKASGDFVLRYGLGSKTFAMRMPAGKALIAKLADYGTADVKSESNGQPISLAQITTLENTPPDFFILGDQAKQGHAHDMFGLGLCMLHLFTGKAPYEEILAEVRCPQYFKKLLRALWEDEKAVGFSVLRSVILSEVYKDEEGNIVEGEPDETFYDTFYRYFVLFGVPEEKFQRRRGGKIWKAIGESLEASVINGRSGKPKRGNDASQFARDRRKYSMSHGTNKFISRARKKLESIHGGMDLLLSLVCFDPDKRATALDVLNSEFFNPLTEMPSTTYGECDDVRSFLAFSI